MGILMFFMYLGMTILAIIALIGAIRLVLLAADFIVDTLFYIFKTIRKG